MKSNYSRYFIIACICVSASLGSKTAAAQAAAPCSLLTSAQVTAAVGVSVGAAQPIANTGCSWSAPHPLALGWERERLGQNQDAAPRRHQDLGFRVGRGRHLFDTGTGWQAVRHLKRQKGRHGLFVQGVWSHGDRANDHGKDARGQRAGQIVAAFLGHLSREPAAEE